MKVQVFLNFGENYNFLIQFLFKKLITTIVCLTPINITVFRFVWLIIPTSFIHRLKQKRFQTLGILLKCRFVYTNRTSSKKCKEFWGPRHYLLLLLLHTLFFYFLFCFVFFAFVLFLKLRILRSLYHTTIFQSQRSKSSQFIWKKIQWANFIPTYIYSVSPHFDSSRY